MAREVAAAVVQPASALDSGVFDAFEQVVARQRCAHADGLESAARVSTGLPRQVLLVRTGEHVCHQ